jgi:hypothetical protein
MTAIALGVLEDLKARRLLPVAIALAVALVALPVLLLKPASDQAVPATGAAATTTPGAATSPATVNGLPGPAQALAGDRPLVSLAALDKASDLESFDAKNPFKPLESLAKVSPDGSSTPATTAPTGGSGASGGQNSTGGGTGNSAPIGGTSPVTPTPTPAPGTGTTPEKRLTYAVDLTFQSPTGTRHLRNVPKLRMLPSEDAPLLVFLGVDATGTNAVFLVDAKLKSTGGEGKCSPSGSNCATLTIEPGERHTFSDDQGERYVLEIDEIRTVSVASAARAARAYDRKIAKTAVGAGARFTPPLITDLLTTVQG